jgi:DNA-binding GntR family transcriptional regulator
VERTPPRFKKSHGRTEVEIRKRILQAIFEQRLSPGEKITEEQLATTFDVSRTVVRQAMARLSQDGILVKSPNVGSAVAAPGRKEARDILAVRRMVEPDIVTLLVNSPVRDDIIARLDEHLALENEARNHGSRGMQVRLSGEFHLLLAEMAGNRILIRLMNQLQALTCLAILLYAGRDEACLPDEHGRIVRAIAAGDDVAAKREVIGHLRHVEQDMNLERGADTASFTESIEWLRGHAGHGTEGIG